MFEEPADLNAWLDDIRALPIAERADAYQSVLLELQAALEAADRLG